MASATTRATPLLTAFRNSRSQTDAQAGKAFAPYQFFLTLMGFLIPVTVCWYLVKVEPLFKVKSIEFTQPDLVAGLVLMVAFARALIKGFDRLPRSMWVTGLLFLVSTLLSALFAMDKLRGFAGAVQVVEFLALLWAFSGVTDARRYLRIIHFTLAVFVFQSLIAMAQFLGGAHAPSGTFEVHQQYAMLTTGCAAVAFGLLSAERVGWKKFLYFVTLCILLIGSLLGQERAPWVAFIFAGVAVVAYAGKKKRKTLLIGFIATVLAAVLLVVSVPTLRDMTISRIEEAQTNTEGQNSLLSRLLLWGIAFKLFIEHPIFGIGPKNFVLMVPHYATKQEMMGADTVDPHNGFVGYLAEQGIVGFLTYVAFCWALVMLAMKLLRKNLPALARTLCIAYLAYNVFWIMMLYPYFMKETGHIHFMMLGLMVGMQRGLALTPTNSTPVLARVDGCI
jgi:O-antigen ligase